MKQAIIKKGKVLAEIFPKLKNTDMDYYGINGNRFVREKYNWENDSAKLIEVYS